MSKATKTKEGAKVNSIPDFVPWSCTHFGDQSEIEAFIPATGKWETIADVHSVGGIDAEDIANFIICAVNKCAENY